MKKEKEPLFDKNSVIRVVKSLIDNTNSVLVVKYLESYDKLVILYKGDHIEVHKDTKTITYLDATIPLKRKEYNEIYRLFMNEVKRRKEIKTLEKFHKLEDSLDDVDKTTEKK
jgi:hypothetical protein